MYGCFFTGPFSPKVCNFGLGRLRALFVDQSLWDMSWSTGNLSGNPNLTSELNFEVGKWVIFGISWKFRQFLKWTLAGRRPMAHLQNSTYFYMSWKPLTSSFWFRSQNWWVYPYFSFYSPKTEKLSYFATNCPHLYIKRKRDSFFFSDFLFKSFQMLQLTITFLGCTREPFRDHEI